MAETAILKVKVSTPSIEELQELGIDKWGIWTCDISKFDWEYTSQEECYFYEGEVLVETANENIELKAGDFVVFPEGLKCVWNVKKPVRKSYNFS